MTAITVFETRPATNDQITAFVKENGVGYRYVRIHNGRCPNCGEPLVQPRGLEDLHDAADASGYACTATLPAQWPMRQVTP